MKVATTASSPASEAKQSGDLTTPLGKRAEKRAAAATAAAQKALAPRAAEDRKRISYSPCGHAISVPSEQARIAASSTLRTLSRPSTRVAVADMVNEPEEG